MNKKRVQKSGQGSLTPSSSEVADFLNKASRVPAPHESQGRLAVIIDATASRQPTWDMASHIQSEMFDAASDTSGLQVQLLFFRGFGELKRSGWMRDPARMQAAMSSVFCKAGLTQIARALDAVTAEAAHSPIAAFVYIGDACEEDIDAIGHAAGKLGARGVKGFIFQEGDDPDAMAVFRQMASLTRGTLESFNQSSPDRLRALLGAAAAYASGGSTGLQRYANKQKGRERDAVLRLTHDLRGQRL